MRRRVLSVVVAAALVLVTGCIEFDDGGVLSVVDDPAVRATNVVWADVAGRGVADAIVLASDGSVTRLTDCGDGCWQRRESVSAGTTATGLGVGDLDGDGVDDVVVGTDNETRAYFGGAAASGRTAGLVATDSVLLDQGRSGGTVVVGDLDGDDDLDVGIRGVSTDPSWPAPQYVEVPGDGTGGFGTAVIRGEWISPGAFAAGPALGDVDGDGDLEALFVEGHALIGNGNLVAFDEGTTVVLRSNVGITVGLGAGDLDGDGRDDVVLRSAYSAPEYSSRLVARCASAAFGPCGTGSTFEHLETDTFEGGEVVVADVDGDGRADVLTTSRTAARLSVWRGLGNGGFARFRSGARIDVPTGPSPAHVAVQPGVAVPDLLVELYAPNAGVRHLENVSTVP